MDSLRLRHDVIDDTGLDLQSNEPLKLHHHFRHSGIGKGQHTGILLRACIGNGLEDLVLMPLVVAGVHLHFHIQSAGFLRAGFDAIPDVTEIASVVSRKNNRNADGPALDGRCSVVDLVAHVVGRLEDLLPQCIRHAFLASQRTMDGGGGNAQLGRDVFDCHFTALTISISGHTPHLACITHADFWLSNHIDATTQPALGSFPFLHRLRKR